MWPELQPLIAEYRESLRHVRRAWERATEPAERQILSSMTRDLEWTIEYMRTGWPPEPGEATREHRRRRVVAVDPHVLAAVVAAREAAAASREGKELDERKRAVIAAAFRGLSQREREAYVLAVGHGYSRREIARMMGVSYRKVTQLIQEASRKVRANARRMLVRRGRITAALISERDLRDRGGLSSEETAGQRRRTA